MRSVDKDRRAPGEEGRRFATTTPDDDPEAGGRPRPQNESGSRRMEW